MADLPEAPWASRPVLPGTGTRTNRAPILEEMIERLRKVFPGLSEEDLRGGVEGLRSAAGAAPRAPRRGDRDPRGGAAEDRLGRSREAAPPLDGDLRLTRFWLEMSAFHVEALALYLRELEKLDPRLARRALRRIEAAEDVLRNEGRSPWGWMVYDSAAETVLRRVRERFPPAGRERFLSRP